MPAFCAEDDARDARTPADPGIRKSINAFVENARYITEGFEIGMQRKFTDWICVPAAKPNRDSLKVAGLKSGSGTGRDREWRIP